MGSVVCAVCSVVLGQVGPIAHQATVTEGLDNPGKVAFTASEALVTDLRAQRINRYDFGGTFIGAWDVPLGPVAVAANPDGRLFVSLRDTAQVAEYDSSFTLLGYVGDGVVTWTQPTALAVDPATQRLYVVDSLADRVVAFESNGALAVVFGSRGAGPGQFRHPGAIAIDAANGRVLVADQDNFRVQVFTPNGVFLSSFGYRIKFLLNGNTEGWFPRTSGLAVSPTGNIYVTDALMGTLRVFDPLGTEIEKLLRYREGPGDLQNPGDVAIDSLGRLWISNSQRGTVEVYEVPGGAAFVRGTTYRGVNSGRTDLLRSRPNPLKGRYGPRDQAGGGGPIVETMTSGWDPPHMFDDTSCGRCHDIDGQPEGHLGTLRGQANLCFSCHTGAGHALDSPLRGEDRVDAGGPPPEGGGRSHAWGVSAVNELVGSLGPPAGSQVAVYLSSGQVKCATCHDQHGNDDGAPFLRVNNDHGGLCLQCHREHVGHTPHGAWQPTCNECHDMHNPASENLGLIGTVVHNQTLAEDKPVVLAARSGANSFDDGDPAANDGICQVCHTATAYHTHDGTGAPHHDGEDCLGCHPHDNGFLPAGGDCTACHAAAQDNGDGVPPGGRRPVVAEFPVADAHAHYGTELNAAACVVCHDQTTHMDGYVELLDPDGAGTYRFIHPEELVSDPDLSNFCAACHDSDGATRLTDPMNPFGNGNVPPDVASSFQGSLEWDELYGDACFGSEGTLRAVNSHHDIHDADQAFSGSKIECLNCHGAHNASAAQPVADPFDTATAWGGDSNGFCLACHNGGTGPLDPGFPPSVIPPTIDVTDPRWVTLGFDWSVILGGACLTNDCSSIRGIDSCDYIEGPWYVDYSWTHTAHGLGSKRAWNGYSGAPEATLDCVVCHDPHGSTTAINPAGNPYMIRDVVDGTAYVDDGTRTAGFNGPPFTTSGVSRPVVVPVSGQDVGWGDPDGLCSACHATWLAAYDFHGFCTGCQTCHGHGMAFGEFDFVDPRDDSPCPAPGTAAGASGAVDTAGKGAGSVPLPLHQLDHAGRTAPTRE